MNGNFVIPQSNEEILRRFTNGIFQKERQVLFQSCVNETVSFFLQKQVQQLRLNGQNAGSKFLTLHIFYFFYRTCNFKIKF